MQVHLVDGTYELFRSHFGSPPATSPSGQAVGATRGLMRSIYSLLRQRDVSHVACAFDSTVKSFRNEMFDGYKTGEGIEPELFEQFPLAERAMRALGVVVWPMIEFEADDALMTGAKKYGADPNVERVVVCSPDKDLAQAVEGERIVCFDRRKRELMNADGVVAKFGVPPDSIPDYLALVGDSADGLPGIARWGAKSTGIVLGHYKKLEAIPDDVEAWDVKVRGAAGLAKNLTEGREASLLYRELAVLRDDVPLTETLDQLRWSGPDEDALIELCSELGFDRFLGDVGIT